MFKQSLALPVQSVRVKHDNRHRYTLVRAVLQMQNELAALSSNHMHRVISGATHGSLQVKQQDAQASSAAIVAMIAAVRTGQPLKVR